MDRRDIENRSFSKEEVGELIETATRLQHLAGDRTSLSFEDLSRIAGELGIEDEALLEAVARRLQQREQSESEARRLEEETRKRAAAWKGWRGHLAAYLGGISGLALMDFATSPSNWPNWFFFPAAGWGIGLLIHTFVLLFRAED